MSTTAMRIVILLLDLYITNLSTPVRIVTMQRHIACIITSFDFNILIDKTQLYSIDLLINSLKTPY
jgi:hypothetical protein